MEQWGGGTMSHLNWGWQGAVQWDSSTAFLLPHQDTCLLVSPSLPRWASTGGNLGPLSPLLAIHCHQSSSRSALHSSASEKLLWPKSPAIWRQSDAKACARSLPVCLFRYDITVRFRTFPWLSVVSTVLPLCTHASKSSMHGLLASTPLLTVLFP